MALYFNSRAKQVEAAWWNPSWQYRKRIDVSNSNGSSLTSFQIRFTLDTAALITGNKLKSNCEDLRITDHQGKEIPFWIEENNPGCNNAATKIWTKMPEIPAAGGSIYLYYGNASASQSSNHDGNAVFEFFDDFNGTDLNTGKWSTDILGAGGEVTQTNGEVTLNPLDNTISSANIRSIPTFTNGITIATRRKFAGTENYIDLSLGSGTPVAWNGDQSSWWHTSLRSGYTWWYQGTGTSDTRFFRVPSSGAGSVLGTSQTKNVFDTQYSVQHMTYTSSGDLLWLLEETLQHSATDTNFLSAAKNIYVSQGEYTSGAGGDSIMDWLTVRKHATSSPTTTLANEETTPGPIAHWKFDEGGGTTIKNSLGLNQTGTISNTTWQSEDCVSESCLQFNGTNSFVDTGFDYSMQYDSSTSFSVWIKPATIDTGGKVENIFGKVSYEYILSQLDGTIMFRHWTDAGNDTIAVQTPSILQANQWYQVTLVYDGSAHTTSIYVDGVLQASGANLQSSFVNRTETLKIGYGYAWNVSPTPYFSGKIDEVKIYPYALTAEQVKKELTLGSAVTVGLEDQGSLGNGLVAYWPMDETTGTTIADATGNGNAITLVTAQETGTSEADGTTTTLIDADHATLSTYDDAYNGMVVAVTGGTGCAIGTGDYNRVRFVTDYTGSTKTFTVGFAFPAETDNCTFEIRHQSQGKFGSGFYADGVGHEGGNDVMELTDIRFNSDDPWSYSVWQKISTGSTTSWNSFFGGNQSGYGGYWQYHGGGGLMWYQDYYESTVYGINDAVVNLGDEIPYDQWFMLTLTYTPTDALHGQAKIYVNGQQVHSRSVTLSARTTYFTVDKLAGAGGRNFEGHMDEARLYKRVLADNEIKDLYSWAPKPKAYYSMDEGTGTSITNRAGGSSATVENTTWISGKYGQALHFNGTNARVALGNINHPFTFTKMAWVKVNIAGCVNESRCSILGPYFEIVSNGQLQMYVSSLSPAGWHSSTVNPTDGAWTHVAVSYDGTNLKLFINGKETKSVAATRQRLIAATNYLGTYSTIRWFSGDIDEVKVYDYARTTQQIVQDMNAGHPVGGSPVGSQLAYWKFDESNGQAGNDTVGNFSATLGTSSASSSDDPTWETQADCKINGCLSFDGGDLVSTPLVTNDDITWTGWFKTSASVQQALFGTNYGNASTFWHGGVVINASGNAVMEVGYIDSGYRYVTGTTTVNDNAWHHIAFTSSSTGSYLYVDGKLDASSAYYVGQVTTAAPQITAIGVKRKPSDVDSQYFNGQIDEVKLYSSALTAEQIAVDMNNGTSSNYGSGSNEAADLTDGSGNVPILEFNFDEMTGTTAKDTSGQNGNGTISGATWNATGKSGSALEFDGQNDYISVDDKTSLQFTETTPFSTELWVKLVNPDFANSYEVPISKRNSNDRYTVYITSSRLVQVDLGDGSSVLRSTGTTILSDNVWYHISFVYDGANNLKLYINGKKEDEDTLTLSGLDTSGVSLFIGNETISSARFFNGLIDQVRIYNYARTPAQITYDYNRGKPIAHWKLDECQGATAYDTSGSNLHGTISSAASLGTCSSSAGDMWKDGATGKYSASLDFDNTVSDSITVADNSTLQLTDELSVCSWVKPNLVSLGSGIFEKTIGGVVNTSYLLFTEGTNYRFRIKTTTTRTVTSTSVLSPGNWTHVCGTFSKSAGGLLKIYVNGKLENSATYNETISTGSGESYIGKLGGNIYPMNGQIDDVQIYNYALSLDQIGKVYNQGSAVRFGE